MAETVTDGVTDGGRDEGTEVRMEGQTEVWMEGWEGEWRQEQTREWTEVRMGGRTEAHLEEQTKVQTTYFQRGWLMKSLSHLAAFSHSAVGPQDCGFEGVGPVLASHLKLKVAVAT